MTIYNHSDSNKRKTWLLITVFFLTVIAIGYAFSYAMESPVILYIAVGFSMVSSFVSYFWSDKIVLKMSNARKLEFEDNKELYRIVENLCITAGLPMPNVYIINDTAPNAFATGRDPEHAVIAVTTGILQKLNKTELEGVIAHELSHIGNRDILLATIVTVLVGTIVLLADFSRRYVWYGGGRKKSRNSEDRRAQVIMMIISIALLILAPIFAKLMQFAISRKREFLADADGALLTRYPEGLARALEKLSADQEPLEVANRATAHMYIVSPFKGQKKAGFFAKAFMTHPSVADRVSALRGREI